MEAKKNLLGMIGLILQFISSILLIFVGIIFWIIYLYGGVISFNFLLIYTVFILYILSTIIYSAINEDFFKLEKENKNVLRLKMNHSLTFSLPLIYLSFKLISLENLGDNFLLFLFGLYCLFLGLIWLIKGYYLRYNKLKNIYKVKK